MESERLCPGRDGGGYGRHGIAAPAADKPAMPANTATAPTDAINAGS